MELCRPPPPRPSARPSASLRLLLTVLQKPSGWLTTHPRGDHPPDRSWGGQPGRGWRWERGWGRGGSTAELLVQSGWSHSNKLNQRWVKKQQQQIVF